MTSVDSNSNFLCGRLHGAGPPSPRPHASTWSLTPLSPPCGRHKWMAPKDRPIGCFLAGKMPSYGSSQESLDLDKKKH